VSWAIHPLDRLDTHADAWSEICSEHYRSHPLLDLKFLRPLIRHFADKHVFLAVDRDERRIQSLLIVQRKRWGVWETFTPSQLPVCPAVTRRTGDWLQAWRALLPALPGYAGLLGALRYDPLYYPEPPTDDDRLESVEYATTMSVDLGGGFAAYWQSRKKKLRDNVSRYFRRMQSDGLACRFDAITEPDAVRNATDGYGELETAGWKGREGTALRADNVQGRFYADVLTNFAENSGACVFGLYADDVLVASRLAIAQNGMLVFLKTTYDERFSRYAPGRLLLHRVLERLCDIPDVRTAEFYTDANDDLLQWCTGSRPIYHLNLYRSRLFQRCVRARRRIQRALREPRPDSTE